MTLQRRPLGRGRLIASGSAILVLVGCALPWFRAGGADGIPPLQGNAFEGPGILVFLAALATLALAALPYAAGDQPVRSTAGGPTRRLVSGCGRPLVRVAGIATAAGGIATMCPIGLPACGCPPSASSAPLATAEIYGRHESRRWSPVRVRSGRAAPLSTSSSNQARGSPSGARPPPRSGRPARRHRGRARKAGRRRTTRPTARGQGRRKAPPSVVLTASRSVDPVSPSEEVAMRRHVAPAVAVPSLHACRIRGRASVQAAASAPDAGAQNPTAIGSEPARETRGMSRSGGDDEMTGATAIQVLTVQPSSRSRTTTRQPVGQ